MMNDKVLYPIEVGAIAFMHGINGMNMMREHDNDDWEVDEWEMADGLYDVHLCKYSGSPYFTVRVVNSKTGEGHVHIKCTRIKPDEYKWENFHPIYTSNK